MRKTPFSVHKVLSSTNQGKFRVVADTEGAAHTEKVKN